MHITVSLFAFFRDGRFREKACEYPPGTTVRSIITSLGIDPGEVGVTMLNSRHCTLDQEVHEGDRLAIFPVIGGG